MSSNLLGDGDGADHTSAVRFPSLYLFPTVGALVLGLGFIVAQAVRPCGRPASAVKATLEALSTADVDRLASEERLGMKDRAAAEIEKRGTAEWERLLGIFRKAEALGDKEYRRCRKETWALGDKALRQQARDDQRWIHDKSKAEWFARTGYAQLGDDEKKLLGSEDVLADKKKLYALAMSLGQTDATDEERAMLQGVDPSATIKDRKLKALVDRVVRSGMGQLKDALQHAAQAANVEWFKLSRHERDRIENDSLNRWVFGHGLDAWNDPAKAKIAGIDVLIDDESDGAAALRRLFGTPLLDGKDRGEIERRNYDNFIDEKKAIVENEGARMWAMFLRQTFPENCCTVGHTRYLGESARSALRNHAATATIEYHGDSVAPTKEQREKRARELAKQAAKFKDQSAVKLEAPITAEEYLGTSVTLRFDKGTWSVESFGRKDGAGKDDDDDKAAARVAGALSALASPAGVVGGVLLALLGFVVVVALVLRRSPAAIPCAEAATAVLLLACLQAGLEGQVSLDDAFFTPLYLALPVWVGAARGVEAGFMAGFLTGLGLVAAAALVTVAPWTAQVGAEVMVGEYFLAALFLAISGSIAGRLAELRFALVGVPLVWLLFYASVHGGLLWSCTFHAHIAHACAVVGGGLLAVEMGLVRRVERYLGRPATT